MKVLKLVQFRANVLINCKMNFPSGRIFVKDSQKCDKYEFTDAEETKQKIPPKFVFLIFSAPTGDKSDTTWEQESTKAQ